MKYSKQLVALLLITLSILIVVSCNRDGKDKENPVTDVTEDVSGDEGEEDWNEESPEASTDQPDFEESETTPPVTEGESEKTNAQVKEIPIYGVNENSLEKEAMMAQIEVEKELTPQTVVEEVIANFQEEIGVSGVEQDGGRIIVSFKEGMAPMARVSAKMETAILDCIAYSLLDNVEDCEEVVYRGENGRYESGHILLEVDEVYVSEYR